MIGDRSDAVAAHREIPRVLAELGADHRWLPTAAPPPVDEIAGMDGLWCVPGSPYRDMDAALGMCG